MAGDMLDVLNDKGWLYHPKYPDDWERCSLYSMAQWVNGLAFRAIQFSPSGMPVIKIAEIKDGISGQTKFTEQTFDESVRVRPGDLLFSWSGQPETSIDVFWWRGPEGWLNQHIFRVTPAPGVDPIFFYYLLRYLKPNFIGIARNKQTIGLGHVTKHDLECIVGAYPPLPEQRAIAAVLGALDDKIELNRRMNRTLEAIAQAVFRHWFVENEEAEGWEIKTLGEFCEFAYGKGLKEEERASGQIPVYGSNGQIGWHNECLVKGPGIVIGRKGNPGIVTWVHTDFFPIDTTFYVQKKDRETSLYWLYYTLVSLNLPNLAADSAVPGLNRNFAYMSEVAYPSNDLMRKFNDFVKPLFLKIHANEQQSRKLAALRDALLPKLMCAEVRVTVHE